MLNIWEYIVYGIIAVVALVFLLMRGRLRDNSYYKGSAVRLTIIYLLSYLIVAYGLGLLTGFARNPISINFSSLLKIILPSVIAIFATEYLRGFLAVKFKQKPGFYVAFCVLIAALMIFAEFDWSVLRDSELFFIFLCTILAKYVAQNAMFAYMSWRVSPVPVIVFRLVMEVGALFLPIFPNLGNFLTSVLGVLLPSAIYFSVSKVVLADEESRGRIVRSAGLNFVMIPVFALSMIIIYLTSGLGSYKMVAIASGSMEETFFRGDAVIYKRTSECADFSEGMVAAYTVSGKLVTHRIISLTETDGDCVIQTKGDANDDADAYQITSENLEGIVSYRIPYIGFPTVWLQSLWQNI